MTYYRANNWVQYSNDCPDDVSPVRWAGILKFFTRFINTEEVEIQNVICKDRERTQLVKG